jgi:hypothetical protein
MFHQSVEQQDHQYRHMLPTAPPTNTSTIANSILRLEFTPFSLRSSSENTQQRRYTSHGLGALQRLYPPIMSWDPNPTITVPTPVTVHPDDGIRRRSWTIFHSHRGWRIGASLNHDGRRWWRRWLSINDCFGAAAKAEQG